MVILHGGSRKNYVCILKIINIFLFKIRSSILMDGIYERIFVLFLLSRELSKLSRRGFDFDYIYLLYI